MLQEIEKYFDLLWNLNRSLTGEGVRKSLKILSEIIPLNFHEINSGTKIFDWEIPEEWNAKEAYIITPDNKKIADFSVNNLHLLGYSEKINKTVSWEELEKHLYYRQDLPEAIPYVTSYYRKKWGFAISYNDYINLPRFGNYKVFIDTEKKHGSLTYGDYVLKGKSKKEILLSSYICHPSMANDNLTGPLALAFLYQKLKKVKNLKYSYRFVICPETIGTLAYLHENGEYLKKYTEYGFVLTCCGDKGNFTFKKTKEENSILNNIVKNYFQYNKNYECNFMPFDPIGSDERQYCSPAFDLPVASLMKTPYHYFKEYHTSLDNKDFISFKSLLETVNVYFDILMSLEINDKYVNQMPYGEPMLGKRNLYPNFACKSKVEDVFKKRMRLLNFCDGKHSLLDIANRFGYSVIELKEELEILKQHNLIK